MTTSYKAFTEIYYLLRTTEWTNWLAGVLLLINEFVPAFLTEIV
jgi:hypothetical protein